MRAIVVVGGEMRDADSNDALWQQVDLIVAADGGAQHLLRRGLVPHVVIGDMDSLTSAQREHLRQLGCRFLSYPERKDETDAELALLYAVEQGAEEIIVLGALGGRLDHTLANVLLLALPELRGTHVRLVDGQQEMILIREQGTIQGEVGDTVSLLPISGNAEGITTRGLEYALDNGTLVFGRTRGVSNVLTAPTAHISVRKGALLCVHSKSR
ncbi:MAG: thiamine diphosphokinase [Anaerolineae bacterium]|nr:thiamine diphosphokinase [Anaerolineae bacterium]